MTSLLRIPEADKARLTVLFLAKHALATGAPDPADGNHAVYHHEMRTTLEAIGLKLIAANSYDAICAKPDADYVVTLLNRGGFLNSEMLAPLLLTRHGIAFMGASPIVRGLSDDKHLMKLAAQYRGVPVTPWMVVRRGHPIQEPDFAWERLVVKPNASSASWGVGIYSDWAEAREKARSIHDEGHDVIIEPHFGAGDVVLPIIGADGPLLLPAMRFVMPGQDDNFRSYEEKRALTEAPKETLEQVKDTELAGRMRAYVEAMLPELWPFDYGRFEFRHEQETGALRFMEVNLSCNLWSKKTVSGAGQMVGISHQQLVETIIAHSMERQGLIRAERVPLPH